MLVRFSIDKEGINSVVETTDPDGNPNVADFATLGLSFDSNQDYAIVVDNYTTFQAQLASYSGKKNETLIFGTYVL